jgi:superfamily II RNA helicase
LLARCADFSSTYTTLDFGCQINSANELVLTELILENALASYDPEEVVALLSCFVFQERTDVEPVLPPKLEAGRDAIVAINDRISEIQDQHKVAVESFRSQLKFGLVEVVYEWAKGMVRILAHDQRWKTNTVDVLSLSSKSQH